MLSGPSEGFLVVPKNRTSWHLIGRNNPQDHRDKLEKQREQELCVRDTQSHTNRRPETHFLLVPAPGDERVKKVSKSDLDSLSNGAESQQMNLTQLRLFSLEENGSKQMYIQPGPGVGVELVPPSPSRTARRQLTEELDREESPRKVKKDRQGRIEEQILFNEGWYDIPEHDSDFKRNKSQSKPSPDNEEDAGSESRGSSKLVYGTGQEQQTSWKYKEGQLVSGKTGIKNTESWLRKMNSSSTRAPTDGTFDKKRNPADGRPSELEIPQKGEKNIRMGNTVWNGLTGVTKMAYSETPKIGVTPSFDLENIDE